MIVRGRHKDIRPLHDDPFPEIFWKGIARQYELTARELEVLRLICRGLSNTAIAKALHIAYPTLRSHVRSVYQKLRCRDRVDSILTLLAISAHQREIHP